MCVLYTESDNQINLKTNHIFYQTFACRWPCIHKPLPDTMCCICMELAFEKLKSPHTNYVYKLIYTIHVFWL